MHFYVEQSWHTGLHACKDVITRHQYLFDPSVDTDTTAFENIPDTTFSLRMTSTHNRDKTTQQTARVP